eukprot:TRINITY_DN20791_c0_g1_i1.p1 TRINITY_DN20791_c0_g1~~TRINITY_DN20791_c0_g1_i1.p1  ORF type:complete len:562 (+),score=31.81 TRINITY_DN20791_c0_g1_i1:15-1700(+)
MVGPYEGPSRAKAYEFNVDIFCEIVAFIYNFPALGAVCRRWHTMLDDDTIYLKVVSRLSAARGVTAEKGNYLTWRDYWLNKYFHLAWRPVGGNLMVDFINSVIDNLSNEEGTLSQIYYTYPRVGLQFKQKFALFEINSCRSLARIALKKGTHLREEPCTEKAAFLTTGLATDRIVKLDFVTAKSQQVTKIVVWTTTTVELFNYVRSRDRGLTVAETKLKYQLCPLQSDRRLPLSTHETQQILVIHINEQCVVSLLSYSSYASVSCYSFDTGQLLYTSRVPGVVRAGIGGEWKSRERFEFKGSSQIGALVDDAGVVQVFHHGAKKWCSVRSKYWELWKVNHGGPMNDTEETGPGAKNGPRPKYVRTTGCHVVVWNSGTLDPDTQTPPYYVEIWKCSLDAATPSLQTHRVLAECYTTISSVHIDEYRCYVNIILENKDVLIDVWDLSMGAFVCRVHAVNNSWSLEKDQVRTHLSKIFWSSDDCLIYYELNTKSDNTNALSFRQLSCVPQGEYWETCRTLKGNDHLKKETHQVLSTTRPLQPLSKVWPSMAATDPMTAATVNDF